MSEQPENMDVVENLILGHFEGELTEDEERELAGLLDSSAEAKQTFLSYMRMEGRLHSMGRDGFLREPSESLQESDWVGGASDSGDQFNVRRRQGSSRRLWASVGSLAACVGVLLIFVWGYQPARANASAVLSQARLAAGEMVDRSYRVLMSEMVAGSDEPVVSEMEMNMRGGGRFVIQPKDKRYVMGNDGTDFWTVILKKGPVWVTDDFFSLSREQTRQFPNLPVVQFASKPDEPLLLELSSILENMEKNYNVELLESEFTGLRHVRAERRDGGQGPLEIDLWVDAETGVTRRLEWGFGGWKSSELTTRVSLVQIQSRVFSESWYSHAEHASGRKVKRLSGVKEDR